MTEGARARCEVYSDHTGPRVHVSSAVCWPAVTTRYIAPIQTIFGFALAMFSVLQIAGDFKEIRAGIEMGKKTWENARNRPSFYVYNHRGKAFSPHYDPTGANQQITDSRRPLMNIPQRFLS